ncbi:MAG: RpiB/LacA/LacB family sugar-phosphate isomerase [Candidatus Hydrogenedentota bacterium]
MNSRTCRIVIGSDHGGYDMKAELIRFLRGQRHEVMDVGCFSRESYDFPVSARDVAHAVSVRAADRGILIDGAGSPSAMVANKVPGVRASVVHDEFTAKISREHSDANVISFGAKVITSDQAKTLVELWLRTDFLGGKYQKRIDMIADVERKSSSIPVRKRLVTSQTLAASNDPAIADNAILTPLAQDQLRARSR